MPLQHRSHRLSVGPELTPALDLHMSVENLPVQKPDGTLAPLDDVGLHDVVSPYAAHGGLIRHAMNGDKPLLWVQDTASRLEFGAPYSRVFWTGHSFSEVLFAPVRNAREALWAMEEAVKAGVNVIGEIEGAPKVLDFTATRRLELFSRAAGVRCMLVRTGRQAQTGVSSGARWRWHVESKTSAIHPYDPRAPGNARWGLQLTRARTCPPGKWAVESHGGTDDQREAHRLRVVSELAAGNMDPCPTPQDAIRPNLRSGNVVSFR